MRTALRPFRWNMGSQGLYRRLGAGDSLSPPAGFKSSLERIALNVLRAGGDVDYVFVGRSLENVYDFLSGAVADSGWRDRVQLLQLSLSHETPGRLRRQHPGALSELWNYFATLKLTPPQLAARPRPVAFVDLVFAGRTFGNLLRLLRSWTGAAPGSWTRVRQRLRWVCLVERDHPTFAPWTPADSEWTRQLSSEAVSCPPIDWRLWRYLADGQEKTTDSFTRFRWSRADRADPPTTARRLQAARFARAQYRAGSWSRRSVSERLLQSFGPTTPPAWARELAQDLASGPSARRGKRSRRSKPRR